MIFAGYGVTAPEFNWDDFKDVDVKGKTIVVLVNDPQVPDPADAVEARSEDVQRQGDDLLRPLDLQVRGRRAARRGRNPDRARDRARRLSRSPVVQGNLREKFDLVTPDKNMGRAAIEGWITLDAAKKILRMAGQDFDALKKQALTREFKPVPLGLKASLGVRNTMRTIDSQNVLAQGRRQRSAACATSTSSTPRTGIISASAHRSRATASTTARSTMPPAWRACSKSRAPSRTVEPKPKRSILFLMVTAEEQGLLGSQYLLGHAGVSAGEDRSPTSTSTASTSGDARRTSPWSAWARRISTTTCATPPPSRARMLRPDPEPEKGFYYRSDHFNFAKQGVPALYTDTGVEFIGKPADYSKQKREEYTNTDYHEPSDEVKPDWDLIGRRRRRAAAFRGRLPRRQRGQVPGMEAGQRVQGEAGRRCFECGGSLSALKAGRIGESASIACIQAASSVFGLFEVGISVQAVLVELQQAA